MAKNYFAAQILLDIADGNDQAVYYIPMLKRGKKVCDPEARHALKLCLEKKIELYKREAERENNLHKEHFKGKLNETRTILDKLNQNEWIAYRGVNFPASFEGKKRQIRGFGWINEREYVNQLILLEKLSPEQARDETNKVFGYNRTAEEIAENYRVWAEEIKKES